MKIGLLLFLTLFVGCTHQTVRPVATNLSPFWVKETVSKPIKAFRKINRFSPIGYENQIIAANSFDGLISYDKISQKENWRLNIPYGVEASGLLAGNVLFVGGLDGSFYSVNADNGTLIWKFETSHEIVSEPLLVNGVIYFLNAANALFSLDAETGKQLWVYNRQETAAKMTIRGGSRPSYSAGNLYVGFSDGSLVSLNSKTGTPQWEILLNKNLRFKDIDSSPVIDGDLIYINSYDDKVYCVSKNNGQIIWKSDFGGSTTPLISGDKLIVGSSRQQLASLNKQNGALNWKKELSGISTDPVTAKGFVLIGESQGKLKLFDLLSGDLKTSFDPGRGIMSKIYVDSQQQIYFISGEGNIYGLKIDTNNRIIPYIQ